MADTAETTSSGGDPIAPIGRDAVPPWLNRLAAIGWRVLVTIALLIVFGAVAVHLATVTGAILVGLTVAAMVSPVVRDLEVRRGWPRARAAAAASFLAVIIVVVALIVIIVAFIPSVVGLIQANQAAVAAMTAKLLELGVPPVILQVVDSAVTGVQAWLVEGIAQLVGPIANFVTIMILGGFLTFYLLEDGDRAWARATGNLRTWQAEALTSRASVALSSVSGYFRGTGLLAVTDGIAATIILFVLGVPFAGPLGVLVFIGGFVPFLGVLATSTVLVLITFLAEGFGAVVILLVFLALLHVLQARTISPRIFGSGPKVNPGIALIAIAIAGALFGMLGLFAAVPVVAVLLAFGPAVVQVLGSGPRELTTGDGIVPIWLDRLAQFSWRTLVVLALLSVVSQVIVIPILSLPVILAAILACVLKPIDIAARKRGLNATASALFATIASIAVVLLVVGLTVYSLVGSLPAIVQQTTVGAGSLNLGATPVDFLRSIGDGLLASVAAAVANAAGIAIGIAIALVLTFFLLRDGGIWWAEILRYVPVSRRGGVDGIGTTSASILYGSMVGTAIVSFAGAVMQFITMAILGLPLAFPISVLMFFGGFIPYIGSLIVTLLGFLVAVSVGSTADIILMGIFTIVFNIVQGNVVAPLVYSKTISVHPAIVLLAAPAGGAIAGLVGMILIVPVIAMIQQTWRTVIHLFEQDPGGATPAPPPTEPPDARVLRAPPMEGPASAPAAGG